MPLLYYYNNLVDKALKAFPSIKSILLDLIFKPITSSNEFPPTDKADDTIPNELANCPEDTENWFAVSLLNIKYKC